MTQCYPRIIDRTNICPREELTFSATPPTCVRVVPVFGDFSIILGQIPPVAHFLVTDRGEVYYLAPIVSPPSVPPEYHAVLDATGCVLIGVEMSQTPRRSLSDAQVEVLPGVIRHVLQTLNLQLSDVTNALPPDRCNSRLWQTILDETSVCLTAQPPAPPPVPQAFSCQAARDCFTAGPGVFITSGNPPYTISAGELRDNGNGSYTWFDTQGNAQFTFFAPGPIRQFIVPIGDPNNTGIIVESPNLLYIPDNANPIVRNLLLAQNNFTFAPFTQLRGINDSLVVARNTQIANLDLNESSMFLDECNFRETIVEQSNVQLRNFTFTSNTSRFWASSFHGFNSSLTSTTGALFAAASFVGIANSSLGYFYTDVGVSNLFQANAAAIAGVNAVQIYRQLTTSAALLADYAFVSATGLDNRTNQDPLFRVARGLFVLDLNNSASPANYNTQMFNSVVLSTFRGRVPSAILNTILLSADTTPHTGVLPFSSFNFIQLNATPVVGGGQNVDRTFRNGIWIGENVETFGSILPARDTFVLIGSRVREDPYALVQIGRNASPTPGEITSGGYSVSLYDGVPMFRMARHQNNVTTFFFMPSFATYNNNNGQITLTDMGSDANAIAQLNASTNNARRTPGTLAVALVNNRVAIFAWNGAQWQRITV